MKNIIGSISTIKNFMGNASRTTCNEYLYEALQDAVESMEKQIPQKPIKNGEYYACPCCKYEFPDIGGVAESYGESEKYAFCPECGQAIKYEE